MPNNEFQEENFRNLKNLKSKQILLIIFIFNSISSKSTLFGKSFYAKVSFSMFIFYRYFSKVNIVKLFFSFLNSLLAFSAIILIILTSLKLWYYSILIDVFHLSTNQERFEYLKICISYFIKAKFIFKHFLRVHLSTCIYNKENVLKFVSAEFTSFISFQFGHQAW